MSFDAELSIPAALGTSADVALSTRRDDDWQVDVHLTCVPELREELWPLYRSSFEPLEIRAAQRHLFTREEFDGLMCDERTEKLVVRDRRRGAGAACLGVITNQLDAVSLVSSGYYRHRWPEHHRQQRIWYVVLTAVAPAYQGTRAVGKVIEFLCELGARAGGVFAADICEFNDRELRFPGAIARLGQAINPGIRHERLDAQVYWAYEVPAPTV